MASSHLGRSWIPREKIEDHVHPEAGIVILVFVLATWLFYKLFLRDLSEERHQNLGQQFKRLVYYSVGFLAIIGLHLGLRNVAEPNTALERIYIYSGLLTLFLGASIFVKASRVTIYEYLFLGSMRAGVPLLIVNIYTLILIVILSGWFATEFLNIRLAPLLATSAFFSVILGLALQDTLGNLFAGVAMQFDKPYEIGDWIEVYVNGQKLVGQVTEISWRATLMLGYADELITIPNRVISQSQVSNFTSNRKPIMRSHTFRIPFEVSIAEVKAAILAGVQNVDLALLDPPALVFVAETTESWISYRLLYYIDDFGVAFTIADQVYTAVLIELQKRKIPLAISQIQVHGTPTLTGPFQ